MTVKEVLQEGINLSCDVISREVGGGMPSKERADKIHRELEGISSAVATLISLNEEPAVDGEDKKVQFLVMFKNKALMCVKAERGEAVGTYNAWALFKAGKGDDAVCSIGDEREEIMGFAFSDVCCIKVILSQKDVGVTG